MENNLLNCEKKILKRLILIYIGGIVLRYVIGIFASQNPFIMPDEDLYANIARSIANGSGISLRNQPLTYTNILYPLLISPAYVFFRAGTQYRVIQLLNCIFMNLAVFPAYGIARKFTDNKNTAFGIAILSLLMPDMLLTTRIMTESIVYPLFLLTVYLMFDKLSGTDVSLGKAAMIGFSSYLLTSAKSGAIALVVVFIGILFYDRIRFGSRSDLYYILVFAGVYAALLLLTRFTLSVTGMDLAQKTIYETQTQAPTLSHLNKTLPGLLLYAFFVPVAFGIFPLLLPFSHMRRFETAQKKQILLILLALVFYAAGACYLFFDSETVGNYFQGRIHIRYVFMFLPVLLCFLYSKNIEGAKPNGKLLGSLGFLLAMTITVSFSALLSNRTYPVDVTMLSYVIYDNANLNWHLLSQIGVITFTVCMLILLYKYGWTKPVKRVFSVCFILVLILSNILGYDLCDYNNTKTLSDDAKQAAGLLSNESALLVPDSGIYFDNTLSVLDTSMVKAPYVMEYADICSNLGDYGKLISVTPPKYWTEKPEKAVPETSHVVFNASIFTKAVLADGADVQYTDNGTYAIVTLPANGRLFHSALTGIQTDGKIGDGAALYIYDQTLLSQKTVRAYFKVSSASLSKISLSVGETAYDFSLNLDSDWIYTDFDVPQGCTVLKINIKTVLGSPSVLTYSVK